MSQQAAEQILETLRLSLRNEMNDIADHMAGGGCTDFNEYTSCAGKIAGLAYAERELLDLDERLYGK